LIRHSAIIAALLSAALPAAGQERLDNAQHEGLDLRAVATLGAQPSPVIATPLLARQDLWDSGAIKSGADLKGVAGRLNYSTPLDLEKVVDPNLVHKAAATLK
jgi:hypothetical protein